MIVIDEIVISMKLICIFIKICMVREFWDTLQMLMCCLA